MISFTTSPARSSPATGGTNDTLPGVDLLFDNIPVSLLSSINSSMGFMGFSLE